MQMNYRSRKLLVGGVLLALTVLLYLVAVPAETPWVGKDSHLLNLSLGLVSGVAVLLFQFLVDNKRDKDLEDLENTRIKRVLDSRDKEDYYGALIAAANTEIVVFGVTANRFLTDFADVLHPEPAKRVLISALDRGVEVRLLLCSRDYLAGEDDKAKHDSAATRIQGIVEGKPTAKVQCRYYKHAPTLSMVVADSAFLVGPVFQGKESKHTSTIHAIAGGAFAKEYWDNFEREWKTAAGNPP